MLLKFTFSNFEKIYFLKKILLLSDSHSHFDEKMVKYIKQADEVWHAGDIGDIAVADEIKKLKPLRAVYGNIDDAKVRQEFPLNNYFEVEGVSVFMTHIGGYPGKYNARVYAELKKHRPKLYICGHSHILKVMNDKNLNCLHMNPGAIGKHGFHQVRTMLRFELDKGSISGLEVVEIKR